jgi:hypothetical protein
MNDQRVVVLRHYEELVEMLVDLQMAADTLSSLTRKALIRMSSLAEEAERFSHPSMSSRGGGPR